ncbi:type IV pilus biogenesis/stability protein PilW [Pseudomarimonas salicorniae]|uniref:Type IV pilus biogenesis/stability protein PilW n=1 Tax=Pseudomarimonas salicorniae TaxID=2933270 RepID=A0ABT0GEJ6_9GAMM|nr:type IV pilus biogenesis/stability protein PilW [Lysobacter sp. CAU 1642]MCK7592975.1 type IV pilus biogenesis/stability protein PilW [Lysobacter sp. CAU 1642]
MRRSALALPLCLLLAGCTGSPSRLGDGPSREQDAAALQVKLGQEYMLKGELETAQDKLRRAIELDPNSVDANTLLGVLNERIRRPEIAERFYRRAVELKPGDGSVNNNLGVFLCAQGKYDEADTHFRAAVDDPFYRTPAAALANAGVCSRQAGQRDRAEDYLRRALELERGNLIALAELANISHSRGESLRARAFIQRYEARAEPDAALLLLGLKVERQLGDSKAAERYARQLRERFPDVELPSEESSTPPS